MSDILTPPEMTFQNLVDRLKEDANFFKNHLEAIFLMKIKENKPDILSSLFNFKFEEEFFTSLDATSNLISSIALLYRLGETSNSGFQSIELKTKKILFFHLSDNTYKVFLVKSDDPIEFFQKTIFLFQLLEDNLILIKKKESTENFDVKGFSILILDLLGIADEFGENYFDPELPIKQMKSKLLTFMSNNYLLTRFLRNRQRLQLNLIVKELVETVLGRKNLLGYGGFSLSQDTEINSLSGKEMDEETQERIFEVLFGEDLSLATYLAKETKLVDDFDLGGGKWIVVSRPSPSSLLYFVVPSQRIANLLKSRIEDVHHLISAILPEFFGY